jgi:hypothetical protein
MKGRIVISPEHVNDIYPKVLIHPDNSSEIIPSPAQINFEAFSTGDLILESLENFFGEDVVIYATSSEGSYVARIDNGVVLESIVTFGGVPVTYNGEFVTYSL